MENKSILSGTPIFISCFCRNIFISGEIQFYTINVLTPHLISPSIFILVSPSMAEKYLLLTIWGPEFKFVPYPVNHNNVITKSLQTHFVPFESYKASYNSTSIYCLKKKNNSDVKIVRFSVQVSVSPSINGFLSRVRTTERLPLTYYTKRCDSVNTHNFSLFTPFSHLTLKITQEVSNTMYCPEKKQCSFLTHSAAVFLQEALLILAAISPVRSLSASTTLTHFLMPISVTFFFSHQAQCCPITTLRFLLHKVRNITFWYRMAIYSVEDIQSQAYKIQGFKFFLLIFLFSWARASIKNAADQQSN